MSSFFKKLLATGAVFSMGLSSVALADRFDPACCPPPACNPCGNWCDNLSVYGSWLYWKVNCDELDYGVVKHRATLDTTTTPDTVYDSESIHDVKGDWDSGFRIGFTFDIPDCCWGLDLNWTHYNSSSSDHHAAHDINGTAVDVIVGLPSVQDFFVPLNTTDDFAVLRGSLNFRYNTVDLEFGRWLCYCNSCLLVRPHIGFRYADINESFKNGIEINGTTTSAPLVAGITTAGFHAKNKFHGLGVRVGFDADLRLCDGWSLIGKTALSLISGRTHIKQSFGYSTGSIVGLYDSEIKENYRQKRAIADLAFGLRYNTCACGCYPVFLELLWENHYLWNQHRFWVDGSYDATALTTTSGWKKNGDLAIQGLTLTLGVDF